jgi:hypothetical protein
MDRPEELAESDLTCNILPWPEIRATVGQGQQWRELRCSG